MKRHGSSPALEALVEGTRDSIFSLDSRYRYTGFNSAHDSAMRKLYGVRVRIGLRYLDLLSPAKERARVKRCIDRALKGRRVVAEVTIGEDPRARSLHRMIFSPLEKRTGKIHGVGVFSEDITKRARAERTILENQARIKEELRESSRMFRFVFENAYDGISLFEEHPDPRQRRLIECNERYAELAGRTRKDLLRVGHTLQFARVIRERSIGSAAHGEVFTGSFSWLRPDGRDNIIEYTAVSIKVRHKTLTIGIDRDVTQQKQAEDAVRASERLLREAQRVGRLGHYNLNITEGRWSSSELLDDVFGIDEHFVRDVEGWLQIVHPNQRQEMALYFSRDVVSARQPFDKEYMIVRPNDKQVRWVHGRGELQCDAGGAPIAMIGTIQDVTERKKTEEDLRQSEERYRAIVDAVPDMLFRLGADGFILDYSAPRDSELFGPTERYLGKNIADVLPPRFAGPATTAIAKALRSGEIAAFEFELSVRGEERSYENRVVPVSKQEVLSVIRDITERRRAEERMRTSLREKEFLLKEVHHRVKNNLQIIASLLNLQAEHTDDERILAQFREAQNRVRSIAMVHEKLYQSANLAEINFSEYLKDVTAGLFRSYGNPRVKLSLDVEEIPLGIDVAIPCGLIINELVSNALKHAFPGDREGTIRLSLRAGGHGNIMLTVEDDGIGISADGGAVRKETLGMTVVSVLVQQLNGDIELDRSSGTRFIIRFKRGLP